MGKVKGNWLTGAHSGRACNHENIYTKVDKKTGKCYSVKLCNPNEDFTETQLKQRDNFGKISAALSAWIKQNRATDTDAYKSVQMQYDRQNKYATLRGFMMAKNMAKIQPDGSVSITVGEVSSSVTVNSGTSGTSGTQSGGGSSTAGDF